MTNRADLATDGPPALDLAPLTLPPPDPSARDLPPVRGQAALSLVFLVATVLVGVLIVVGLVVVNVVLWRLGRIAPGLIILAGLAVFGLGRALVASIRRPPDDPGEIEIPTDAEPELHAMIRQLAEQASTRPPDRVVMVAAVNAYVHEFGPVMGLVAGRRTLAIGAPLLDALDVSQLRSVLGHELGHFAGGDTRIGPIIYRTSQVVGQLARSFRGGFLSSLFVRLWLLQYRTTAPARRRQELIADRRAVAIAGRQATADALARVEVASRAEAVYVARVLAPLVRAGHRPADPVSAYRAVLADGPLIAELAADAGRDESRGDPLAAHPPTPERIASVAALSDDHPPAHDGRRAAVLLRDPARWAGQAIDAFLAAVPGAPALTALDVTAWADVLGVQPLRERAETVDRALVALGAAPDLEGLRGVLADGRRAELAASLAAAGWPSFGADVATEILRDASSTLLARRALDRGATPTLSPSGAIGLAAPTGGPVPLEAWADDALAGRWEQVTAPLAIGAPSTPVDGAAERPAAVGALATLPDPPSLFGPAEPPWRYQAVVPAQFGRDKVWAVSDSAVSLDGDVAAFDQIVSLQLKLESAAVGSSVSCRVRVRTRDGETLKTTTGAMSGTKRDDALAAITYLWNVMAAMVAPHVRNDLVERVQRGEPVEVAGISFTTAGVQLRRQAFVPWAGVGAAVVDGHQVVIPTGTESITAAFNIDDSFVLASLVNELRARYGSISA